MEKRFLPNHDGPTTKTCGNDEKRSGFHKIDRFENVLWKLKPSDHKRNMVDQGAIRKNYYTESDDFTNVPPCHFPRRNKRNPYKWYKNSGEHNAQSEKKASNISNESKVEAPHPQNPLFNSLPFYYVVPENPTHAKILPPGKYLVIPQNVISNKPLRVFQSDENVEQFEKNGNGFCESNRNYSVSNSRNKGNDYGAVKKNGSRMQRETGKYKQKNIKMAQMDAENWQYDETSRELREESSHENSIEKSPEHLTDDDGRLSDTVLADIVTKLPYFDLDFIEAEWNKVKSECSVDTFLERMKDRRINEVHMRIISRLPHVDELALIRVIPDIYTRDDDIERFIEMEKTALEKRLLSALRREVNDATLDEFHHLYERFGDKFEPDEEKDMLALFKTELEISRAEDAKIKQLQMICTLIPDVEPDYVLSKLEGWKGSIKILNEILEELLENPNHPKTTEYDAKAREQRRLWKNYVTNYSPENFLRRVPDPEHYFLAEPKRKNKIKRKTAIEFLTKRYPDLDNFQLNEAFTESGKSIFKTCALLDKNYMNESVIDEDLKNEDLDEEFLQEITFIVHKEEILRHLREEKERREIEITLAEKENSFFECLLCFDNKIIPSEAMPCPDGHITCRYCLLTYVVTVFGEGKIEFPCPKVSCDLEFPMKTIEKVVYPDLFSKISQKRAAEDVDKANLPGLEKCPACEYAYVLPPDDKVFVCSNEDCMRVSCRLCKDLSHIPLSCKEIERPKDIRARLQVEEAMTEKMVRSCPTCRKPFIKIDGCNKMTCVCGTVSCYICSEIVKNYSHFNGQGGTEFHKCPLFSENEKLHHVDVLEAGIKMKEKVMRENPDINFLHDPTNNY